MQYRFGQTSSDILTASTPLGMRSDVETFNPLYQVHDVNAADIQTVKRIVGEMIRIAGAAVQVHTRTDNDDVDGVWDEDPDPTYWNPKLFKAFFVPQPLEFELTQWGVDVPNNQTDIVFALDDVVTEWPTRLLRPGDLIEIPYNSLSVQKPKYFYVNNAQESGNFRYIWLYMKCTCALLTGDVNIRPATDQVQAIGFNSPDDDPSHR